MNTLIYLFAFVFFISPCFATDDALDWQKMSLSGNCGNRMEFARGETMPFSITVDFQGQKPSSAYYVEWQRIGDDGKKESGRVRVSDGSKISIPTSLDIPGFVRIEAFLVDGNARKVKKKDKKGRDTAIFFAGGACVEPDKLKGFPEPADFDSFWKKQKEKLDKIPLKYTMKKVSEKKNCDVFAVSVDCAGPRPVTGYLTVPAGAGEKSFPAVVHYPAFGIAVQRPPESGRRDRIDFMINAHGYDLGRDAAYYQNFFKSINGKQYVFDDKLCADPETAYFNGMALRVMQSLRFVKALLMWDGKNLQVKGTSQGGLQTFWAAALDPDVTFVTASIPWCCDLGGMKLGRFAGWRKKHYPALDYFDPVNHAKRICCPVEIQRAGLGDKTSPPAGVTILFNNLSSPKKITYVQGSEHGYVPPDPQLFIKEKNAFRKNSFARQ